MHYAIKGLLFKPIALLSELQYKGGWLISIYSTILWNLTRLQMVTDQDVTVL